MEKYLRKLKLLDDETITLEIEKTEFVKKLKSIVNKGSVNFLPDIFDTFSSSKNNYRGIVGVDFFEIKRRKSFFHEMPETAIAFGRYKQNSNQLAISIEYNAFNNIFLLYYLVIIVLFFSFITSYVSNGFHDNLDLPIPSPIFITITILFMSYIPYRIMRKSIEELKYNLKRDLLYIIKD